MFDHLTTFFWAIAYFLIIIAGYKSRYTKLISMPYFALFCNFAWEACALLETKGNTFTHVIWFFLDCFIIIIGFCFLKTNKERLRFAIKLVAMLIIFKLLFIIPEMKGAFISSFVIDFTMSALFIIQRNKLSSEFRVSIAAARLAGNICATIYYAHQSPVIAVLASLILICDIAYLVLCIIDWNKNRKTVKYDRKNFRKYFG